MLGPASSDSGILTREYVMEPAGEEFPLRLARHEREPPSTMVTGA